MMSDDPTGGGLEVREHVPAIRNREEAPGGTASLILGILGLTVVPFILSIVALFPGYRSKREAQARPELYRDEFGRAGRILGWIGVVFGLFVLIPVLVVLVLLYLP
jgi:hypothetical protein